jgi:hypothetical protein
MAYEFKAAIGRGWEIPCREGYGTRRTTFDGVSGME